jgi:hypothetical protein
MREVTSPSLILSKQIDPTDKHFDEVHGQLFAMHLRLTARGNP